MSREIEPHEYIRMRVTLPAKGSRPAVTIEGTPVAVRVEDDGVYIDFGYVAEIDDELTYVIPLVVLRDMARAIGWEPD